MRLKLGLIVVAVAACAVAADAARAGQRSKAPAPAAEQSATKPLAVVDGDIGDLEVALLEVKRTSGGTLTVRWQYRNKGSRGMSVGTGREVAEGSYLLDQTNKKKYLVVRDAQNQPVGANHHADVRAGSTLGTWAKFPAPPETVERISVVVPHAPPFDDVPISKGTP